MDLNDRPTKPWTDKNLALLRQGYDEGWKLAEIMQKTKETRPRILHMARKLHLLHKRYLEDDTANTREAKSRKKPTPFQLHKGDPRYQRKRRSCLQCGKSFSSSWCGQRICYVCKRAEARFDELTSR